MYTRRDFGRLTLGGLALPFLNGAAEPSVGGVRLGAQTYSFRALPRPEGDDQIDGSIDARKRCGVSECELFAPQVEPRQKTRDDLRAWRLKTPIDHFRDVKKKFDAAGMSIYAYNYSFSRDMTDAEI